MTVRITVERISDGELRVTLTADIRVSGDLGSLLHVQGAGRGRRAVGRRALPFRSS
jgi:hypothetical protein